MHTLTFRSGLYLTLLVATLHLFAGVVIFRGQLGFSGLEYGFIADGVKVATGKHPLDFDADRLYQATAHPLADPAAMRESNASEPPGYALLLALPIAFGMKPIAAAIAVNLLASFGCILLGYLIATLLMEPCYALMAASTLALNTLMLTNVLSLGVEPVFVFSLLLPTYFLLRLYLQEEGETSVAGAVALGVLIALPLYLRYIGIALIGSAFLLIFWQTLHRRGSGPSLKTPAILLSVTTVLAFLLAFWNRMSSGIWSGHPVGVQPGYTWPHAFTRMLGESFRFTVLPYPIAFRAAEDARYELLLCLLAGFVLLFFFASNAWKKAGALIAAVLGAYLVGFSLAESMTRLDIINARFIYPAIPFFILSIFILARAPGFRVRALRSYLTAALIAMFLGTVAGGLLMTAHGAVPLAMNYSPHTLAAAEAELESEEHVFINRYGVQLNIVRPDLKLHMVPFSDLGGYSRAYSIHMSTREELIQEIQKFGIRRIVFFTGKHDREPLLSDGVYGDYMRGIVEGTDSLVKSVERFPDGRIITLNP